MSAGAGDDATLEGAGADRDRYEAWWRTRHHRLVRLAVFFFPVDNRRPWWTSGIRARTYQALAARYGVRLRYGGEGGTPYWGEWIRGTDPPRMPQLAFVLAWLLGTPRDAGDWTPFHDVGPGDAPPPAVLARWLDERAQDARLAAWYEAERRHAVYLRARGVEPGITEDELRFRIAALRAGGE